MIRTVVHFTDSTALGGAEAMLLRILRHLDRERWRPVLLHYPNDAAQALAEEAGRLDVETRVVPGRVGAAGLTELPALVRAIGAERPAILHAHLVWALRCTRGLLAARIARVPAVVATQQLFVAPESRPPRRKHRVVSRLVDRYMAVSAAMAAEMRPLIAGKGRLSVVRNAIEPDRFLADGAARAAVRASLTGAVDRPILLTLARLDFQKGLDHLIETAALLPEPIFAVAGDGPERERLEALARDRGVAERVRFLGRREDVAELLGACDVYVLPSLFEGLPVSVLEAMAAGRPVAATRIGGTDEAVVDGVTGRLVPPGDPPALAAALAAMLRDPEGLCSMGAAGRARVVERFSATTMGANVGRVYDEVLGLNRSAAPGETVRTGGM
jgi:glycosyltransferase involved in cell wall biosynthesis